MSARGGVADRYKNNSQVRILEILGAFCVLVLSSCSRDFETGPLVEYATEVSVGGDDAPSVTRTLGAGIYLVEVGERDIDLRVKIDAGDTPVELADGYRRHGLHHYVVRLTGTRKLKIGMRSIDQRSWRGSAALRILRWAPPAVDTAPDELLLGYEALGKGNALVAGDTPDSWRASLAPLREAAAHFMSARDTAALAHAEYVRAWVEYNLLYQFTESRQTAQAAQTHYEVAGDRTGALRASTLHALASIALAEEKNADTQGGDQRALFDAAETRLAAAQSYFEANDNVSDAISALLLRAYRYLDTGDYDKAAGYYAIVEERASERGDLASKSIALGNLAWIANRRGETARAVEIYQQLLPMTDRQRQPDLYALQHANLGGYLAELGDFDRALTYQSEALEIFSARNDRGQRARVLAALGSTHFRAGNVARALEMVQGALPLYEETRDQIGLMQALRIAGNAAGELGQHKLALEYLRQAERQDPNPLMVERTRVLIAGEMRALGELRGADRLLAQVMPTNNELTRASALAERAHLRHRQGKRLMALADLREADAIYARLKLDIDRIDTSASLAFALIEAGDLPAASESAENAIALERRVRVKSTNPELRARFLSASYSPYEARIAVAFASPDGDEPAGIWQTFRLAETVRARSLADRLAHQRAGSKVPGDAQTETLRQKLTSLQLRLEDLSRSEKPGVNDVLEVRRAIDETRAELDSRLAVDRAIQASAETSIAATREATQAALPPNTAVLAYFVGDRGSHAWLLTRTELRHHSLPGRAILESAVRKFVGKQKSSKSSPADPSIGLLVGNLLDGVTADRLLVLPDGPLNGLPFAGLPLPNGKPGETLLDRYVIGSAPSLALAMRATSHVKVTHSRVAVISDPVYEPDDRRLALAPSSIAASYRGGDERSPGVLSRLPYSAVEARAVARAFAGADVIQLAGFDATVQRVFELPATELGVLHFATHAIARKDAPEQSALFLTEYTRTGAALRLNRLTTDDITRSGLRADVVVLSGCSTGDGGELRGEGVLGLTYGFLANGSRTVVASLWPIEDAMTARFMEEFYNSYRASGRASEALRIAQLRTRDSMAPSIWSSFVVRANGFP